MISGCISTDVVEPDKAAQHSLPSSLRKTSERNRRLIGCHQLTFFSMRENGGQKVEPFEINYAKLCISTSAFESKLLNMKLIELAKNMHIKSKMQLVLARLSGLWSRTRQLN